MKPGNPEAVQDLFDRVAPSYDLMNDLFSFGLHRFWKRRLLKWLRPSEGEYWLDLCCGTGDLGLALARHLGEGGRVLGVDSASQPLLLASRKSVQRNLLNISWAQLDALDTGLPSAHFDGAVMAYGLRNVSSPLEALKEMRRLLKPGAKAGVLDFNKQLEGSWRYKFQKLYLRRVVVPIAARFGLQSEYAYLEESLKAFPTPLQQEKLGYEAGFKGSIYRSIALGQMGVLLLKA